MNQALAFSEHIVTALSACADSAVCALHRVLVAGDLCRETARGIHIGGSAAYGPRLWHPKPRDVIQQRMVQHLGSLIGHAIRSSFDDQVIGLRRHHFFKAHGGKGRLAEFPSKIHQPRPRNEIVNQCIRSGEKAASLVIGGNPALTGARKASKIPVHARNQRLAALRMADGSRELANLGNDISITIGNGEIERRVIPVRYGNDSGIATRRHADDQVRLYRQNFLGRAIKDRNVANLTRHSGHVTISGVPRETGDLLRVGQFDKVLVGTEIERDDTLRSVRLLGSFCRWAGRGETDDNCGAHGDTECKVSDGRHCDATHNNTHPGNKRHRASNPIAR